MRACEEEHGVFSIVDVSGVACAVFVKLLFVGIAHLKQRVFADAIPGV